MSDDITVKLDLTDPAVLARECETLAVGMNQQSVALSGRGPTSGHPDPSAFYAQVAAVLSASATFVKGLIAPVESVGKSGPQTPPEPQSKKKEK